MPFDLFRFLAACWFMIEIDACRKRIEEAHAAGHRIAQRWALLQQVG